MRLPSLSNTTPNVVTGPCHLQEEATGAQLLELLNLRVADFERLRQREEAFLVNQTGLLGRLRVDAEQKPRYTKEDDRFQLRSLSPEHASLEETIAKLESISLNMNLINMALAEMRWFSKLIKPERTYTLGVGDLQFFGFGRAINLVFDHGGDGEGPFMIGHQRSNG